MAYVLIRHKVADYDKWKPVYDGDKATRKDLGSRQAMLFRSAENPNEILALFEWDSIQQAQTFVHNPQLAEKMHAAGVVDKPDIYFLNETERTDA